jgi:hypothetical protein
MLEMDEIKLFQINAQQFRHISIMDESEISRIGKVLP